MQETDLLIHPHWLVPVEPSTEVHDDYSVAVSHGRIVAVGPRAEMQEQFSAGREIERATHLMIPGLVNAHTHAAMTLMRGMADDLPLSEWLEDHIWPIERRFVGPEFVRDGTELALVEMIRGGTTCFNDMYFFPDVVARTSAEFGVRATVGIIVLDFASPWAADASAYISKGLEVHDDYRDHPLIGAAFAPHAPYTVEDETLGKIGALAAELDVPIHMHVHETRTEVQQSLERWSLRPLARVEELGLLTPSLLAVHMTQLKEGEINQLANTGTHVVHCPESNLKLASGFCPVATLIANGINVALGTDGAASNNDLDMIGEMRTAALLGKCISGNPASVSASTVLEMATINGARALGIDESTGSIVADKWADLVCVDLAHPNTEPVYNPLSQLVYSAGRNQVSDVWVAGRALLTDGELTSVDEQEVLEKARRWRSLLTEG